MIRTFSPSPHDRQEPSGGYAATCEPREQRARAQQRWAGRASAIRQHVLEMPAPAAADALGYHPVTTAKLAAQAAGTWSRYSPGGHLRSPSVWNPGETHDS
jgi:hypothetical protein